MFRSLRFAVAALAAAFLLAACAPANAGDSPGAPIQENLVLEVTPGVHGDGPGISIAEALAQPNRLVLVNGALFVDPDGVVRLCDAFAESYPPQCGGDWIEVVGLGLDDIELEEANGVRWAEQVQVAGTVRTL
jgi:hypothetical protein